MWLDAIAGLVLVACVFLGARRGGLSSALGLLSLGGSYAAALLAAPRLGPVAAERLAVPGPVGMAVAGAAAFALAYLVLGLVSFALRRIDRRRAELGRSARDRFLGGIFGALRGVVVVLLLAWLGLWLEALRAVGGAPGLPPLGSSTAAVVTGRVVEAGVKAALSDAPGSRVVARAAGRPDRVFGELNELMGDPRVDALREDKLFWTYVEHGAVDAALNQLTFLSITHDESMRIRLADMGLVAPEAGADAAAFRAAAEEMLIELGPRLRRLREDPGLQELMADPEVLAMAQSGDALSLMSDPRLREIVARISAD